MHSVDVKIRVFPHGEELPLPAYQSALASGADLYAAVEEDSIISPGERACIPTGIAIELPPGYEAQIRPRSGLALKHGISLVNAPGTIDADYRGEIKIILINLADTAFSLTRGMRIAQMVIAPVYKARFHLSDTLDETARNAGGFGHTGH